VRCKENALLYQSTRHTLAVAIIGQRITDGVSKGYTNKESTGEVATYPPLEDPTPVHYPVVSEGCEP
jgi:hypothetical protein